jgi:hypothetical protein
MKHFQVNFSCLLSVKLENIYYILLLKSNYVWRPSNHAPRLFDAEDRFQRNLYILYFHLVLFDKDLGSEVNI